MDALLNTIGKELPTAAVAAAFAWAMFTLVKGQLLHANEVIDGLLSKILDRLEGCPRRDPSADRREA